MIVCLCRSVSDRAIAAALAGGAQGPEGIARATGAGTDCGCCRDAIAALVTARPTPCSTSPCPGCPNAPARDRPA